MSVAPFENPGLATGGTGEIWAKAAQLGRGIGIGAVYALVAMSFNIVLHLPPGGRYTWVLEVDGHKTTLADRYVRWYESHARTKRPPMESVPAEAAHDPTRSAMIAKTNRNLRMMSRNWWNESFVSFVAT